MPEYADVETIRKRLPYSATALGFGDTEAYDDVLEELRAEEIERIETWGSVVTSQERADQLHDGGDPRTAFEEFTVDVEIDGRAAIRTPRETSRNRHTRRRNSDNRLDFGGVRPHHSRRRKRTLPLPGRPVQSVESVELLERDTDLEIDKDVYLERHALVLDRSAPVVEWPQSRRNVRVEFTFGFDGVPARIRDVLVDLVHIRLAKDQSLPVESESVGGDSTTYRDPGELMGAAFGTVLSETEEPHRGGVFSV